MNAKKTTKKAIRDRNEKAGAIAAALLLASTGPARAADWDFGASVTVSETYTDNVTLGASNTAQSDWISAITPTFTVKKEGARLKVDASYSNQNLVYAKDSARNTTHHQLRANAKAELLEKEIFLDVSSSISQAPISPLSASGVDNTSATGNLNSVRTLNISPYWKHRFGSAANLDARYTISDVGNSNGSLSGSTNSGTSVALASGTDFGRVVWGLNFNDRTIDYQDRSDVSFTTTAANLGYLLTPRVKISGTVGSEKNNYVNALGLETGGTFWNTGVSWSPSKRTSLDLGFGHHYYGNAWNLAFKTRGAHSSWTADYAEAVNTSNAQSSFGRDASKLELIPYVVPSDGRFSYDVYAADGTTIIPANTLILEGTQVSIPISLQFVDPTQLLSNQVFLSKRFSTNFTWKKGKSGITLNAYHAKQSSLENSQLSSTLLTGAFQNYNALKQVGFNAGWTWDFSPQTRSSVRVGVSRNTYPDLSREDTTTSLQLELNRKFTPHWNGVVILRRQERDSNQDAGFTENALSGSLTYTF